MKKEKSCGAVIYYKEEQNLYLVIQQLLGHYTFVKGHVENTETESETAIREITEETGLEVKLDTDFRIINTYKPKKGFIKDVVYFVAQSSSKDVQMQKEEVIDYKWLPIEKAIQLLTHSNDKIILQEADKYLNE